MKKILKTFKILSFIIIPPLIVFIYFFGWGWLVPYELQPSYWQFRNMCKINELPNDEEKYNKILSYYDTSLDTLDWEKIANNLYLNDYGEYIHKVKKRYNRIGSSLFFIFNSKIVSQKNIDNMWLYVEWDNKRKYFEQESIASYNFVFKADFENCIIDIKEINDK
ncbi:hypothetical protein [Helicobacter sp. MIT 03-1614]|uniref:hypothetical protein n=1 Tax=Helicobacter sp. MIT 03-1614 TaxID=1548147 RepID=UPI00068E3DA3|nr:hypothetical protein [Helicobacter sp. MIT 03-1614]